MHIRIDPHSEGCISENTKVYIRIPDGAQGSSINMYYGNAGMHDVHPRTSVSQVFDLSESGARVLNYESYEFAVEEGLTDAPLPVRMTNVQTGSDVFMLQNEASYVTEELIQTGGWSNVQTFVEVIAFLHYCVLFDFSKFCLFEGSWHLGL